MVRIYPILIAILAVLAGCGRSEKSERPVIAVSTPAIGRIVEEIGGEDVQTVVLLPSGADPENFEPDMASMKRASEADAFLSLNTMGFEQRLTDQLHSAVPDLKSIDLSKGVAFLTDTHGHSHGGGSTAAQSEGDPHLLSSPENARIIAGNTVEALSRLYPERAGSFRNRGASVDSLLAARQDAARRLLKGKEGSAVVVLHPSISYYAREFGLRQIALERDGKETTPRQLEDRLKEAQGANPRLMVSDRTHNPEQADRIAKRLGLPVVSTDFNAADFAEQYTQLAKALAATTQP